MNAWHFVTRFGEAQILLPAALLVGLLLASRPEGRPAASRWLAGLVLATGLTTLTKIAFIGWGIGSASLNFTGVSGHSMYASAIYPVLLAACAELLIGRGRMAAALLGAVIALVVGVSRLAVDAHSVSEVIAGFVVGGAVSLAVLYAEHWHAPRLQRWLQGGALAAIALWLFGASAWSPPSPTHALVTRIALRLSGHEHPYTRAQLLHTLHQRLDTSIARL